MQTQTKRPSKRTVSIPLSQVGESDRIALTDIVLTLLATESRKAENNVA